MIIHTADIQPGLFFLYAVKSIGPKGLPGIFISKLKSSLSPILLLFRHSLDKANFPDMWKLCSVFPILKSGDTHKNENYRPIPILSHICKLFESLVLKSIQSSVNPIIINERYSFRHGRSSINSKVLFSNYIYYAFNSNSKVDTIFLDIKKRSIV